MIGIFIGTAPAFGASSVNDHIISLSPDGKPDNNAGESLASYPEVSAAQSEKIIRGEYLVKIGDCVACHTVKNGKPFAGGLGFDTPFGIIYSSNITPDIKTGIGGWNFQQFKQAVTQGIAPRGYLYPAMPYIYYHIVTDQDLADIKAYLDAVPAVADKIPKNNLIFPLNWRTLQLGWRWLFFELQKQTSYRPNPNQSPEWNRGAYLVLGLGHCGMCHTPMHYLLFKNWVLGAPVRHDHLSGAFVSGFYAPNITQLFIENVPFEQFQAVFLDAKLVEGGPVAGPMFQAVHDSLRYLTPEDIHAIYVYLSTVKSAVAEKPLLDPHDPNRGKIIYNRYCKQCHEEGKGPIEGAPRRGDQWAWAALKKSGMDSLIYYTMNGVDGMPIKGTCTDCTQEELEDAIIYLMQGTEIVRP